MGLTFSVHYLLTGKSFITEHWDGKYCLNSSSQTTRIHFFYIVNTKPADESVMQAARGSIAMVST